ncbi:hypothetical protein GCM10008020_15040 [Massilia psychrophila]|nr:hypothetical protein GCM10008020_15040 [Massilia psychrophila]
MLLGLAPLLFIGMGIGLTRIGPLLLWRLGLLLRCRAALGAWRRHVTVRLLLLLLGIAAPVTLAVLPGKRRQAGA